MVVMSLWNMLLREIVYRRLSTLIGLLGVVGAAASLVGVLLSLEIHAARSKAIVHQKQAETRAAMEALESDVKNAMHRLGYNAIVLPVDQSLSDWYADDYTQKVIPEAWCARLEQTDQLVEGTRCRRSFCKNTTVSRRLLLPFAYSSSLLRR